MRPMILGNGLVGSNLHNKLDSIGVEGIIKGDIKPSEKTHKIDVTDSSALKAFVGQHRPDLVFFLANYINAEAPGREVDVQVGGFQNTVRACLKYGVKRVVIPQSRDVHRITAQSKPQLARICQNGRDINHLIDTYRQEIDIVTLEFPQVCGPNEDPVGEPKRLRNLIKACLRINSQTSALVSGNPVPYAHIDDAAENLARLALEAPENGSYSLGAVDIEPQAIFDFTGNSSVSIAKPKFAYEFSPLGTSPDQIKLPTTRDELIQKYTEDITRDSY